MLGMGYDDSRHDGPPALSAVAVQINERELRMRCLELAARMTEGWRKNGATRFPNPQLIADDLLAYVMTGENRDLFRERP